MFKKKLFICNACGYVGKPKITMEGNFVLELFLWLFFIIPGILYSIWRSSNQTKACPKCQNPTMVPVDSPVGQKLINKFKK